MINDQQLPDIEVGRYALRTFKCDNNHLWPVAIAVDAWKDGTCTATCEAGSRAVSWGTPVVGGRIQPSEGAHEAPQMGCNCGIYGTLSLKHLSDQWYDFTEKLVCVIAAEGSTILGSKGLRTARARVVAYWSDEAEVRKAVEGQFKDAVRYKRLVDMLDKFQIPVLGEGTNNDLHRFA